MAVVVPETITVHLGKPDANAPNITIPFTDYIKNVASSEIYPTWPENAIRANVIAQISLALNRIYTEYYRSKGYDFDITNSTQYDQAFQPGREYFSNISEIVDELFNTYVVIRGTVQPYYTEYCDGQRVSCPGLKQWGTVTLANRGLSPYEILQYYYGENIDLKKAEPGENIKSYPGIPLKLGTVDEEVLIVQRQLNRISRNYPAIPKIPRSDGVFDKTTENAVKAFQKIFNLTQDGVVGESTWYSIKRIYNAVKKLSELYSEGISISESQRVFPYQLKNGSSGIYVRVLQYYFAFFAYFNNMLPTVKVDGFFGKETENAVKVFQNYQGLPQTGIVDRPTWNLMIKEYNNILSSLPSGLQSYSNLIYPGFVLTVGSEGETVRQLQGFLKEISKNIKSVPNVDVDGKFGQQTKKAVEAIQSLYGLPVTGDVGALVWNNIVELYKDYKGL